jgi:hypothetical protein
LVPALGHAQVVVNQAALRQLAGIEPPAPPPVLAPAVPRHRVVHRAMRKPALRLPTATANPAVAKPAPPPQVAPVIAKPLPPPAPITLHFASGSADLPPGSDAVLKSLCGSKSFIAINATAPGSAADPSIAMRLSLSRALAVRDALTACGVKSTSILPRALGSVPGRDDNTTMVSVAK